MWSWCFTLSAFPTLWGSIHMTTPERRYKRGQNIDVAKNIWASSGCAGSVTITSCTTERYAIDRVCPLHMIARPQSVGSPGSARRRLLLRTAYTTEHDYFPSFRFPRGGIKLLRPASRTTGLINTARLAKHRQASILARTVRLWMDTSLLVCVHVLGTPP